MDTNTLSDDAGPLTIVFARAETLMGVCGPDNRYLKPLRNRTGASLEVRGTEVFITGPEAAVLLARRTIECLREVVLAGHSLSLADCERCVSFLEEDSQARFIDLYRHPVFTTTSGRRILAKNVSQKRYVDAISEQDVVFALGPAGTGKTYLAVALAVRLLLAHRVKRIVLTRPAVEAGEHLGFLPGALEDKVDPYLRPLYDALYDMLDPSRVRKLVEEQVIEVAPLAFMRGRTLADSFVIVDEGQNTTASQMKMLLTRLGEGSKAVVTGDPTQSDLSASSLSGLAHACTVLENVRGVGVCRFANSDVVRHPLVQRIVRAYEEHGDR